MGTFKILVTLERLVYKSESAENASEICEILTSHNISRSKVFYS